MNTQTPGTRKRGFHGRRRCFGRSWIGLPVVTLMVVSMTACGTSTATGGNASASAHPTPSLVNYITAPPGAVVLSPNPGPVVKAPITGNPLRLPYFSDYPVPAGPIGNPHKTYTFCFSQSLIDNPWVTAQKESVMLEAARHPNVKILYFNTNADSLQQVQDINTCLSLHVNGILVWPNTVGALTPEITKLCAAHILVIGMERTVDTHCPNSWIYLDYLGEMNEVTQAICKQVNDTGIIGHVPGTLGSSPQILREEGLVAGIHKYCPHVKIVTTPATDFGEETGYQVGLTFLSSPASTGVKAIWCDSTEIAQGVLRAEQKLGKKIPLYGSDASRVQIRLVEDGELAGILDHTPLHGDLALRLAIMAVEGKSIPKYVDLKALPLIVPQNAAQAYATGWGPA